MTILHQNQTKRKPRPKVYRVEEGGSTKGIEAGSVIKLDGRRYRRGWDGHLHRLNPEQRRLAAEYVKARVW